MMCDGDVSSMTSKSSQISKTSNKLGLAVTCCDLLKFNSSLSGTSFMSSGTVFGRIFTARFGCENNNESALPFGNWPAMQSARQSRRTEVRIGCCFARHSIHCSHLLCSSCLCQLPEPQHRQQHEGSSLVEHKQPNNCTTKRTTTTMTALRNAYDYMLIL